jgi:hypothetical protein
MGWGGCHLSGTGTTLNDAIPALKRRATFDHPSGMGKAVFPVEEAMSES